LSTTFLVTNGDVVINPSGRPTLIQDAQKVRQDLAEMILIETQPNGFGASLISIIGHESGDIHDGISANIEFLIRDRITDATSRFINLQRNNLTIRPLSEQLIGLNALEVAPSASSPTKYIWMAAWETALHKFVTHKGKVGN